MAVDQQQIEPSVIIDIQNTWSPSPRYSEVTPMPEANVTSLKE